MRLPLALLILIGLASASDAAVLRVWSSKYPTIQSAINAAKNGDTVLVGKGQFWESIDFKGKAITVKSELGPEVTKIRGTVWFRNNETRKSVLQGFSIWAPLPDVKTNQGVVMVNASPTLRGNWIGLDPKRFILGVSITCTGGKPLIEGNWIRFGVRRPKKYNDTIHSSGICLYGSDAEVLYNVIEDHRSLGNNSIKVRDTVLGGGMYVSGGAPLIEGNLIRANTCEGETLRGGGIYLIDSRARILRNAILDNEFYGFMGGASQRGAGIYASRGNVEIQGNVISGNGNTGGGSGGSGAGIYCEAGRIIHNSITGNKWKSGFFSAGGVYGSSSTQVHNNILWNNVAMGGASIWNVPSKNVHTNLIGDGQFKGVNGNITGDPLFVNAAGGDFHLRPGSPCIDAGSAVAAPIPALDFDFEPRLIDGRGDTRAAADMGADEFATLRKPAIFVKPGTQVPLALEVLSAAGRGYVLACAFGYSTGTALPPPDPRRIPLNADALFALSVAQNNATFGAFAGALDAKGKAAASITVPALPALAGVTFHAGGIALRPDGKIVILNRLDIDVLP